MRTVSFGAVVLRPRSCVDPRVINERVPALRHCGTLKLVSPRSHARFETPRAQSTAGEVDAELETMLCYDNVLDFLGEAAPRT